MQRRPIDLGLTHLRLPVGAVVSVLHRVSGVVLVLAFPGALWMLDRTLSGPVAFAHVVETMHHPLSRMGLAVVIWLLAHHFFAGARHLLLDLDLGSSLRTARRSAYWVLILGLLATFWIVL